MDQMLCLNIALTGLPIWLDFEFVIEWKLNVMDGTLLIGVNCTPGSLVEGNFAKIYNREPISK
jgi:hypothetical protein